MEGLIHKLEEKAEQKFDEIFHRERHPEGTPHGESGNGESSGHFTPQMQQQDQARQGHRFESFAPPSSGGVKWFVDGASYFWAVSCALERKLCTSRSKLNAF